jgi:hypothetical protein
MKKIDYSQEQFLTYCKTLQAGCLGFQPRGSTEFAPEL